MALRLLRGTDAAVSGYYGSLGEVVVNTDNNSVHIMDGVTPGGYEVPNETTVMSTITNSITTYTSSGGTLPSSTVTFAEESWVEGKLPPQGTASNATSQAIQWDGSKFYIATAPSTGGGGSGVIPTTPTPPGHVLIWTNSNTYSTSDAFALKPTVSTPTENALAWDVSTGWKNVDLSNYAIDADVTAVDTRVTTLLGAATTDGDTLEKLELLVKDRTIKPSASSNTGEFLRWDATANSGLGGFINQVPSGTSSGSSIPTPTADTDTTNKEVLVWDQTLGSLKNTTSDFALVNGATTLTDLSLIENEIALKAPTPTATRNSNAEFLYWDVSSSSFAYGVPYSNTVNTPAVSTPGTHVIKWNLANNEFENVQLSVAGFTDMGSITPPIGSGSTDVLQWDAVNNKFINTTGFATQQFVTDKLLDISEASTNNQTLQWNGTKLVNKTIGPALPSSGTEVVKWNGSSFENVQVSNAGFTDMGSITPPTASGSTDVLQWDGTSGAFVNVSGFAQIGSAGTYTDLGLVETYLNNNDTQVSQLVSDMAAKADMPSQGTDPTTECLGWDALNNQFTVVSFGAISGVMELINDTINNEWVIRPRPSLLV